MTALAWLAPWLLGIGVWLVACGWPRRRAAWCAAAGGGWLLGNLAIGLALGGLQWAVSPQATVRVIGPWVLALGVLLTMLAWRWRRSAVTACPEPPLTWFGRALIGLLLMLLALRWGWMWQQATLPPLFPWDAWAAWSVKPAVWFSLDQWVPFVDASHWLSSADRGLYTSAAAGYPAWLGRLELWYAAGMGCWCDPAYTRLWPALWLALLLALYGLLRGLGVGRLIAVLAVYVLGSLPLLDVHAAMAGYADLWLAAYLVLGVLLWLHAWRLGGRARAALAVLLVLALPAVKLEGAVWMLLVLAAMAFALLPLRWRQRVVRWGAVAMAVLWLAVFVAGLPLPVPGLGLVYVDGSGLHVPGRAALPLGWHPVLGSILANLFAVSSWQLLFYLVPVLLWWRWGAADRSLRLLGGLLLAGVMVQTGLFLFTAAASWAVTFTSSGRLLLQWVPLLVAWLALLVAMPTLTRRETE